jgi:hypothetical protein
MSSGLGKIICSDIYSKSSTTIFDLVVRNVERPKAKKSPPPQEGRRGAGDELPQWGLRGIRSLEAALVGVDLVQFLEYTSP